MTATATENTPTLAMRRLGARLRRIREAAGKTRDDAALALGSSISKIYRIESGRTLAKPPDVRELGIIYNVGETELGELLRLARSAKQSGLMDGYRDVVSGELSLLADLEAVANELAYWDSELVPGIAQTPDYSAAMIEMTHLPDDVRRRRQQFRLARQRLLLEREPPVRLRVVIGEAALTYRVGDGALMAAQRQHLVQLSGRGLDIRVRPFAAGPHRWTAGGPFTILGFPDDADPAVVYTESHLDSRYMETNRELDEYWKIFGELYVSAIPVKEYCNG